MVQVVNDFIMSRNLEKDELIKILESDKIDEEEVKASADSFLLPGFQEAESRVFFMRPCENIVQNYLGNFCIKYVNENFEPKS